MSDDNVKPVIEAMLFSSERPLTLEQIKNALDGLGTEEIRGVLEELRGEYERFGRGMRINEVAGGFQMITSPGFAPFLKKLYKERRVERLSRPALETLAIVAYKQPLSRAQVESLRNVNVDGVIKHLLGRDLIRITGRKKAPGRPFVFGTTRKFLEYFGLKSLEELPKLEEFKRLTTEEIDGPKEPARKS
ncbi:MAG: SMC-Scp complex subunit ScpB [Candidatus Omnitrophica bacterium]|nr:SMC-Scp complex subunit ScpB [Candidatus Omnitrophota bacterium]